MAGWWKTKVTHLIAKITGCCRCQGCFGSRLLLQCAAEGAWGQQPWPCPCNQLPYVAWRSRNTRHESRNSPISPAITPQQPLPGTFTSLHRFWRCCCASFPCMCHWQRQMYMQATKSPKNAALYNHTAASLQQQGRLSPWCTHSPFQICRIGTCTGVLQNCMWDPN